MNYEQFLSGKQLVSKSCGIEPGIVNASAFDFQGDIIRWALRRGRAAIFADCGLGKSLMQLDWANRVSFQGDVLILAPLAVAEQTVEESAKFGFTVPVAYRRDRSEVTPGITVANYEMLDHFDVDRFVGIVLDESSVLKHYTSKTRNQIIAAFEKTPYRLACTATPAHLGDCVDVVSAMPNDSIGFSIFSPPFASLYTYSASERDMGNCKNMDEFKKHFEFLVGELFRIIKPGRLVSFHCMNMPTIKSHHGYIGIQDFRGDLIRMFRAAGFIFHSEVCIWKDPVTAMQRTKALGLLWKQIKKDSSMSRQGIPDYLVTMRKPGDNDEFVSHSAAEFPVALWQQWASPVWMDINPSDTLSFRMAREENDERHICPLQLEVIRRALILWSNPGDLVLSPFAGIGSEGYVSLQNGRRFIGVELKESYFTQAVANLKSVTVAKEDDLFADQERSQTQVA